MMHEEKIINDLIAAGRDVLLIATATTDQGSPQTDYLVPGQEYQALLVAVSRALGEELHHQARIRLCCNPQGYRSCELMAGHGRDRG